MISSIALPHQYWTDGYVDTLTLPANVVDSATSDEAAMRLFVLPAYSPQLNPDQWV
jgi:hypothetical protein